MNKLFLLLSFLMGVVVLSSNYLVQFPIKHYGLDEMLTYGAFSYPIAFLITDLANKTYGKVFARKIVYIGFAIGISFTLLFSTNFAVTFRALENPILSALPWLFTQIPFKPKNIAPL